MAQFKLLTHLFLAYLSVSAIDTHQIIFYMATLSQTTAGSCNNVGILI